LGSGVVQCASRTDVFRQLMPRSCAVALYRELAVAAGIEPAARALWEQAQSLRLGGACAVVDRLAEIGGLPDGLTGDEAADIAWLSVVAALTRALRCSTLRRAPTACSRLSVTPARSTGAGL
jgi:hypothetical protein